MIDSSNPDFTYTPASLKRPIFGYKPASPITPPYVTIVTPFYNTESIFHETARSVMQQSFQQWEWLIINDGSTNPEALFVLESYRQIDARIQIIDLDANRGLSAARNIGFNAARTQYVVQLDSDDLLEPTAIEKWLWFLESHPEFSFCKGYSVGFGAEQYLWKRGFHDNKGFLDENLVDATSMIRKSIHQKIGGYDESDRGGLMDWDFWLRCASQGYWGNTVPEYLNWYRRRPSHHDRWSDFDRGNKQKYYQANLRKKYENLWMDGFPDIPLRWYTPNDSVSDELTFENRLQKDKPRLLMILPWMAMGGADKFNLDLLKQLNGYGWEVTIAATLEENFSWLPLFARYTSDIFIMYHFLNLRDYPRFLRYLIQSRQVDAVLISNSELGYLLLPYLRSHFPDVAFLDFCHMEEESWKDDLPICLENIDQEWRKSGGYPRLAIEYQDLLDLNVVCSEHLKKWMIQRGGNAGRISTCYININSEEWRPDDQQRAAIRQELNVQETLPVVLYAGRICPQKQPRVFAQTIFKLQKEKLDFIAIVAGDGPDLRWLRSFIKKHKLNDYMRLLGAVSNERIKQLMIAADIFFLPSRWEGIALAIYEAMACGLPIVGADVGGQRELVTAECGILIAPSNEKTESQQYAEILAELLKNPQRQKQIGQNGRKRVSTKFQLEKMGTRMEALFKQARVPDKGRPMDVWLGFH